MKLLSAQQVRELQLAILDDFHAFCMAHNLRYSLSGGSLLGAVRHKGFIPWDDDIDIMMPRPDFERFINEYSSDKLYYKIDYYTTDPYYISAFAKIIDERTYTVGPNIIDDRNVFIDIFPIDGMPGETEIDSYVNEIQDILDKLRKCGKYYKFEPSLFRKFLFGIKYLIKTIGMPSLKKQFYRLEQIIAKYPFGSTAHAGVSVGQYAKREWMPKEVFEEYTLLNFEGRKIMGLSDYDTYLSHLYSDYMKLPPEEQRVPMHFHNVYIK